MRRQSIQRMGTLRALCPLLVIWTLALLQPVAAQTAGPAPNRQPRNPVAGWDTTVRDFHIGFANAAVRLRRDLRPVHSSCRQERVLICRWDVGPVTINVTSRDDQRRMGEVAAIATGASALPQLREVSLAIAAFIEPSASVEDVEGRVQTLFDNSHIAGFDAMTFIDRTQMRLRDAPSGMGRVFLLTVRRVP